MASLEIGIADFLAGIIPIFARMQAFTSCISFGALIRLGACASCLLEETR